MKGVFVMNKRLIALVLSLLMMMTLTFAGCSTDDTETPAESAAGTATVTPRQLFADGLEKAMTKTLGARVNINQDAKSTMQIKLNQLSVEGTDVLGGNPLELALDMAYDADSDLTQMGLDFTLFSEKFHGEVVGNDQAVYLTDLFGLNDQPISIDLAQLMAMTEGAEMPELNQSVEQAEEMTAELMEGLTQLMEQLEQNFDAMVSENIPDSAFASETKDCTVGGTEFKGATVVTLNLDTTMIANLVVDLYNMVKDNQMMQLFLMNGAQAPALDAQTVMDEMGNYTLQVANTIVAGETVGLEAALTDVAGTTRFTLDSYMLDNAFLLQLKSGTDGLELTGNKDASGNVTGALNIFQNGQTITPVRVLGTETNGKFDGTLTIDVDGQGGSLDFSLLVSDTAFEFELKQITVNTAEMQMTLPMTLKIVDRIEGTKETVELQAKVSVENMMALDLSATAVIENTDVTVAAITDAVPMDQVDTSTWAAKLIEQHPGLMMGLMSAMQGGMGDADMSGLMDMIV